MTLPNGVNLKTALKLVSCLILVLPLLAQDKPVDKPAPAKMAQSQPAGQDKSLGQVARESKKEAVKPADSKVLQNDDVAPARSSSEPTSSERKDVVQHFQDYASSHTAEETRSELQNWMHAELLKLVGNKPEDSAKTNDQLIDEAKKQAPDSDAARIEQLLKQVRDAGLLDDAPPAPDPSAK
jgi:hypothetical protein